MCRLKRVLFSWDESACCVRRGRHNILVTEKNGKLTGREVVALPDSVNFVATRRQATWPTFFVCLVEGDILRKMMFLEYDEKMKIKKLRKMLRLALIQMGVTSNKAANLQKACEFIAAAKTKGAELAVLPECFNSPYGVQYFADYCENVPNGESCQRLSEAARSNSINVVGGSLPELDESDGKMYNTCPVFDKTGSFIGKFRKMHLYNIHIPGKITFMESDSLNSGSQFLMFNLNPTWKIGIGICFDIRFPEFSNYYTERDCNFLLFPGAFNTTTGPDYWESIQRSRAVDNQLFVATCSPARDPSATYVAWGHSMATDPWGKKLGELDEKEGMLMVDLDPAQVENVRAAIPTRGQRRPDVYYGASQNSKV